MITISTPTRIKIVRNKTAHQQIPFRSLVDDKKKYFFSKRVFDIIFSSLFLVMIFSWVLPIISILIKLSSRGPVFFVQRRVGRGGRSFRCLKFRSMVVNSEADYLQAKQNDMRVTRIGAILRRCNIDEFPQFLNVLTGDMSIVGPRPHMHKDCLKFNSAVEGYKFRNVVKPGITGLAQVKGYRGATPTVESIINRFKYDAFYIRNCSFLLDVQVIMLTIGQSIFHIFTQWMPKHKERKAESEYKRLAA